MHTIRLLQTAEQILSTGKLNIRVSIREELLDIKTRLLGYVVNISYTDSAVLQTVPTKESKQ
jgi:hypothetical protein